MVILDAGSAISSAQSMQQAQQQTIESTIELLSKLLRLFSGTSKEGQQDSSVLDKASPQDRNQIDQLCAQSVKDLLQERGTQEMTDDGMRHVYRAEGYTLSANLLDGTGNPVYTVSSDTRGDILSFQDHPTQPGQHVFYETEHKFNDKEATVLLQLLQKSLTTQLEAVQQSQLSTQQAAAQPSTPQSDRSSSPANPIRTTLAKDIAQLGEFAPRGSKAAFFINEAAQQIPLGGSIEGQNYSIRRDDDCSLELYKGNLPKAGETKEPLMLVSESGKVICSKAMDSATLSEFDQQFDRLISSTQTQTQAKAAPAKEQSRGGRE